jgi:hypothetical protein
MILNSNNTSKTNNHFLTELTEHKQKPRPMTLMGQARKCGEV